MKIIFDVGANWGHSTLDLITKTPDAICFAFEPTPKLIDHLKNEVSKRQISNRYHIVEKAVSDFNGTSNFNIAGQADWGCSSLLEFSEGLDKTWPGRTDFRVTEKITVEVITLEKYIEEFASIKIDKIDYFHCDTQGSDLKVLRGLGKYIDLVEAGDIEVSAQNPLYKDQHTRDESIEFLESHNFMITKLDPNDLHFNEFNLYFKKRH